MIQSRVRKRAQKKAPEFGGSQIILQCLVRPKILLKVEDFLFDVFAF